MRVLLHQVRLAHLRCVPSLVGGGVCPVAPGAGDGHLCRQLALFGGHFVREPQAKVVGFAMRPAIVRGVDVGFLRDPVPDEVLARVGVLCEHAAAVARVDAVVPHPLNALVDGGRQGRGRRAAIRGRRVAHGDPCGRVLRCTEQEFSRHFTARQVGGSDVLAVDDGAVRQGAVEVVCELQATALRAATDKEAVIVGALEPPKRVRGDGRRRR